jgi:hypothetical protein
MTPDPDRDTTPLARLRRGLVGESRRTVHLIPSRPSRSHRTTPPHVS